jgi:1-acyl-sn-glycerol-3-phosphate acyltransferase
MILWTILCISTSLVVLLVTFSRKMPLVMARTIWSPGILFIASAKIEVTGLENIENSKTYIVAANHSSYLDIPIAFNALPLNLHFIAKKELKKVPFLGWYMMATDMIFINRGNNKEASQSLKDAAKLIQDGKTVLIFPEGTVSEDGHIKRFKKGGFHLALEAGVEVLPMSIKGADEVWPTNSNTKFKKGTVKVNIGRPINIENYTYSQLNNITLEVKIEVERLKAMN